VGSDVVAVRRSLGNVLVGILGVVSDTLCVKRRAAVKLDWALKPQPAWLALGTSLATKKVVLHLRVEFKFVPRGAFACWCAGNRNVPSTVVACAACDFACRRGCSLGHLGSCVPLDCHSVAFCARRSGLDFAANPRRVGLVLRA